MTARPLDTPAPPDGPSARVGPPATRVGPPVPGAGDLAIRPEDGPDAAYLSLVEQVRAEGLLERPVRTEVARVALGTVLLASGWVVFGLLGDSWWQVATAVLLAAGFGQAGFLAHDAGHRQLSPSRRHNDVIGLLAGNLAIGLSYGWWVDKHNRHHGHPNELGRDPDVVLGAIAWTPEQVDQASARLPALGLLARYQAWAFVPLLFLEALNLHVSSVRAFANPALRFRRTGIALLALHAVALVFVAFLVLSPLRAVVFLLVLQGLLGVYLGGAFAPNHKGMPLVGPRDRADFLRRQVLASRNVRGGRLVDLGLGGLNYQIEHHLFPAMPMGNLHAAQPAVRALCAEHGIPYRERTLRQSYAETLTYLHRVGAAARARPDR
ncbi:MAG: acyl-CoA desaturase [Actinomycetota bacterium]|nr:acyl-CoA desaturase [Actinomycetota bacterium]